MHFAEAFAWCMLQVTVFTLLVACLHLAATHRQWGGNAALLLFELYIGNSLDLGDAQLRKRTMVGVATLRPAQAPSNRELNEASPASTKLVSERIQLPNSIETISLNSPAAEAASSSLEQGVSWWIFIVGIAWATVAVGSVRFLIAVATLWRLRRSSRAIDDAPLLKLFEELRREIDEKRAIRLCESPSLGVAATCGWWRPIILLPATWRQWTPDERRAVLAHELAHIREGHFPKWLFSQLAVVAHFYHPIVHWLARRLRFEQEVAADLLASRVFGNRARYASALAALALGAPLPSGAVASLGLFMSKPFLMRRLAMLRRTANPKQTQERLKRVLVLSLVFAAGITAAGLRAEGQSTPAESASQVLNPLQETAKTKTATESSRNTVVSFVKSPAPDCYVTALFRVSREQKRLLDGSSSQSDAGWEVFCKTQIALLKSYFVLQSAVRDPEIAELPMLKSAKDPVGFLAQRLEVGFYPGSEILYVRMGFSHTDEFALAKQAVQIVDAVAKAYEEEVIFKEKQRQLSASDLLAKNYKTLTDEIRRKMEDYQQIVREAGRVESGAGQVAQQLDIRRLERVEEELMRLESNFVELQTSGKTGNTKFFEERIAQLSKRRDQLEQKIISRSEPSAELSERQRELERLQRIADELSTKLELTRIEVDSPNRIERIQHAVITDASQPHAAPAK
jgi:beta-lactamase regulating signal transducer with metallopeptidase domain